MTTSLPGDLWHGWRQFSFGPDGKLYIAIGAPSNNEVPGKWTYKDSVTGARSQFPYASIIRMNADGSKAELYATGAQAPALVPCTPLPHHV